MPHHTIQCVQHNTHNACNTINAVSHNAKCNTVQYRQPDANYNAMRIMQSKIPYSAMPYCTIPCCTTHFHAIPYSAIPYPTLPHHTTPHHTTPTCDGCPPPVWPNWTLVQAGAQQVGLAKVTPVLWVVSDSSAPKPKKVVWLETYLRRERNCMNPAENLTTNQPL